VRAFGQYATLAELLLTNTLVSLFARRDADPRRYRGKRGGDRLLPFGDRETERHGAAIALVVRLLTFYLPSIWGGFAMRWLRRQAYL
jgi:hypothetical protein